MSAAVLWLGLVKETRALLPTWAACAFVLVLEALTAFPGLFSISLLAYGMGTIALGAQAVGHEFSNRTLALLLSQPADRRRLFAIKLASLIVPIVTLGALAAIVLVPHSVPHREPHPLAIVMLATACSLFLAPALTIAARSSLAGTVFTVAIAGMAMLAAEILVGVLHADQIGPAAQAFKIRFFTSIMVIACAVGAAASWLMFMRLEVIDGEAAELQLPRWAGGAADGGAAEPRARRSHPVWLLVRKELRLQHMTFVLAGAYALGCLVLIALQPVVPALARFPLAPISILSFGLLSILIGALASAEERQLGTHQWQLLLPVAAWKQWCVKASVVLCLAVLLSVGLPAALAAAFAGSAVDLWVIVRAWRTMTVTVVLIATGSLYVSSLCGSGIKAMAAALPFMIAMVAFGNIVAALVLRAVIRGPGTGPHAGSPGAFNVLVLVAAGSVVIFLLRLGFLNHRYQDRSAAGIALQLLSIVVLVGFATLFTIAGLTRG